MSIFIGLLELWGLLNLLVFVALYEPNSARHWDGSDG